MVRLSALTCGLALLLACDETAEALGDLCGQPVLFVVTEDVAGSDPEALCEGESGECQSLRAALNAAAVCAPSADAQTIELVDGGTYDVADADPQPDFLRLEWQDATDALGPAGLPPILGNVTIDGRGAGLVASGGLRLFNVPSGGALTLSDLSVADSTTGEDGGVVSNAGTLTVQGCSFTNVSVGRQTGARGGVIYNAGTMTVSDSTFSNNAASIGQSIFTDFEGASPPQAVIRTSTFTDHLSIESPVENGGGGDLLVEDCTFADNTTDNGGITSRGATTIRRSTFTRNTGVNTAGVRVLDGTVQIESSTFTGNTARASGALWCGGSGDTVIAIDSTIVENTAETGIAGGVFLADSCTADYRNTLLGANSPADCSAPVATDLGNMDSDGSCGFALTGAPGVEPLADNGGATQTRALSSTSGAVDAGTTCEATDQTGAARPQGGGCDIGAVESF